MLGIAGTEIEPTTSLAENAALTTGIPSGNKGVKYFSSLLHIQSQKGNKLKNPAAEQRSSQQGYTVRAKAAPDRAR